MSVQEKDPVWDAFQKAPVNTTPMSQEFKEKRERGLRDVAARNFVDRRTIDAVIGSAR